MKIAHLRLDQNHMATTFELRLSCEEPAVARAEGVLARAHRRIAELEDQLTEFRETSPVHRLNRSPAKTRIRFPEPAFRLLERSLSLRDLTQGRFDPLAKSGPRSTTGARLGLDPASLEVWREDETAHLGFGAIGKGFALDQVRLLLEQEGFHDYLLSAGGSSLILSGFASPRVPWEWAFSWKKDRQGRSLGIPLRHESGETVAIGVSGTHEKGQHIIVPLAMPPTMTADVPPPLSTLVGTASAADADALSTALFVGGWENGRAALGELPLRLALACIDAEETPRWNGVFRKLWGDLGEPQSRASLRAALVGAAALASTVSRAETAAAPTTSEPAPAPPAPAAPAAPITPAPAEGEAGTVDLSNLGGSTNAAGEPQEHFNPYSFERSRGWMLLPVFALSIVLIHLKKVRRNAMKIQKSNLQVSVTTFATLALLWASVERASAVQFEPAGVALQKLLGTTKVSQKAFGDQGTAFFVKEGGKLTKIAFLQKGLFEPSCTHTWAISLDAVTGAVEGIRVIEMSCPHAFPAKADSFLEVYKGKKPADAATLSAAVTPIAKATGTCNLTTDAVVRSLKLFQENKAKL